MRTSWYVRKLTFILFRAMGGILSYKGFPEQFDDLCHISVEPRSLSFYTFFNVVNVRETNSEKVLDCWAVF